MLALAPGERIPISLGGTLTFEAWVTGLLGAYPRAVQKEKKL